MALEVKVIPFTILASQTAGTTIAVAGVGGTPKAIIFNWNGRSESVDTTGGASYRLGVGFAVSPTSRRAVGIHSVNVVGTSNTQMFNTDVACIATINSGEVIDGRADLNSLDADGFTIIIDTQFPVDMVVHATCIFGDSLTAAEILQFDAPAVTGNQDVAGTIDGDAVIFAAIGRGGAPEQERGDASLSMGFAVSATEEATLAIGSEDAAGTTNARSYCFGGECISIFRGDPAGRLRDRAEFVQFNVGGGFRLNWLEVDNTPTIFALVLEGGDYSVDFITTQTDLVTQMNITGLASRPVGALYISAFNPQSAQDVDDADARWMFGMAGLPQANGARSGQDRDALGTTAIAAGIEYDAVYASITVGSLLDGTVQLGFFEANGMRHVMSKVDSAMRFVAVLSMGPREALQVPVVGGGPVVLDELTSGITTIVMGGPGAAGGTIPGVPVATVKDVLLPATSNLVEFWDPREAGGNEMPGIFGGNEGQFGTGPEIDASDPTPGGAFLDYDGVAEYVDCAGNFDGHPLDLTTLSAIIVVNPDLVTLTRTVFAKAFAFGGSNHQWVLRIQPTAEWALLWGDTVGTLQTVLGGVNSATAVLQTIGFSVAPGSQILYRDAVSIGSTVVANAMRSVDAAKVLFGSFRFTPSPFELWDGLIGVGLLWDRVLTQPEFAAAHNGLRALAPYSGLPLAS